MSWLEDPPSSWGWSGEWHWAADDNEAEGGLIERLPAEFAPLVDTNIVTPIVQP